MIYLELLFGFLKVGSFSFGGAYAAIPLIRDLVLSYGWISDEMLSYMIAVSESTPGPIMVNLATYIGSTKAGFWGALTATFAVVFPSFIIILLLVAFFKSLIKNRFVQAALKGMKPCIIGIVLANGVFMAMNNCFSPSSASFFDAGACALTAVLATILFAARPVIKKSLSPIAFILISAAFGIAVYGL